MPSEAPVRCDVPGLDLGKYRLLGELGNGGMADVYLAVADGPEGFRKLCVLKLMKEVMAHDQEYRAMFLDEARLAARLNHPNVVQTFEAGETHERLMIVMEYIDGQPLTRVRRRLTAEQFPLAASISVLCDVLDALEYAHRLTDFDGSTLGIVHRDVSPHNIVLGYDGRVKLVDFGIAKSAAALQETQAGVLKGKVAYMAPEQARMSEVDGRADVFSVGVILWEAIAGRKLTEGLHARDVLIRRIQGEDPRISDVAPSADPELARICDRAMAPLAVERYASAAELQSDLEKWLRCHGEPSRKELSRTLREAFQVDRERLRSLVDQRMRDSANQSGVRPMLDLSMPSSRRRAAEPVAELAPAAVDAPPGARPLATALPTASPRRARSRRVLAVMAIGVAVGVGAAVSVAMTTTTPEPVSLATRDTATAAPGAPLAEPLAAPTPAEDPPAVTAPASPPTTHAPPRSPPAFFVAPARPPVATHAPVGVPAPAPVALPARPKQAARPLDEKDPYNP